MPKRPKPWDQVKEKIANKRLRKDIESDIEHITVQRLSSDVSGKWQKYSRMGSLESVKMPSDKPLCFETIQEACKSHFNMYQSTCDILGGERGPSLYEMSQLPDLKSPKSVLHIRFIEKELPIIKTSMLYKSPFEKYTHKSDTSCSRTFPNSHSLAAQHSFNKNTPPSKIASSVPLSSLLKMGKLILPTTNVMTIMLEEFSVESHQWLPAFQSTFNIDCSKFASGGFRDAFKAKSVSGLIGEKNYVLKKYKKGSEEDIKKYFKSIEDHTRKSVQMHSLARHFAKQLAIIAPSSYGQVLKYDKIYFGSVNEEPVTLEPYLEGEFVKYVNNNGEIFETEDENLQKKAESFAHFTYFKSNGSIVVLDIQGVNHTLTDPEIASRELLDDAEGVIYFCCGNLSATAMNNFLSHHTCNDYCKQLQLTPFENKENA